MRSFNLHAQLSSLLSK